MVNLASNIVPIKLLWKIFWAHTHNMQFLIYKFQILAKTLGSEILMLFEGGQSELAFFTDTCFLKVGRL